jgi:hypothetical protein
MKHLLTAGNYLMAEEDTDKAWEELEKQGFANNLHHYWIAEESVRNGDKVTSKHLYSFGKTKPNKKIAKKLLKEKWQSLKFWLDYSEEHPRWKPHTDRVMNQCFKLEETIEKLGWS